jgi:hypothetical protein
MKNVFLALILITSTLLTISSGCGCLLLGDKDDCDCSGKCPQQCEPADCPDGVCPIGSLPADGPAASTWKKPIGPPITEIGSLPSHASDEIRAGNWQCVKCRQAMRGIEVHTTWIDDRPYSLMCQGCWHTSTPREIEQYATRWLNYQLITPRDHDAIITRLQLDRATK